MSQKSRIWFWRLFIIDIYQWWLSTLQFKCKLNHKRLKNYFHVISTCPVYAMYPIILVNSYCWKCGAKPKVMTPARCDGKGGSNCLQTHIISTSQKGERQISTDLTSITVHHTGNKVHTILPLKTSILAILQKCIFSCNASRSRLLSQFCPKTVTAFLLRLRCRIASQWTLRSDVWQEMSDFSSLVQDRFLTVSVAGTHFWSISSFILYSCPTIRKSDAAKYSYVCIINNWCLNKITWISVRWET